MDKQVNSICKSAFFHLRNIGSIRNILTDDACSQLIHSMVTLRIDHCNSLLYGMPESTLFRLQKIINTAAHIFYIFLGERFLLLVSKNIDRKYKRLLYIFFKKIQNFLTLPTVSGNYIGFQISNVLQSTFFLLTYQRLNIDVS